jgi:hypothetical protein
MRIESKEEILELRSRIYENATKTYDRIVQNINNISPFDLFADIKFNKFGLDPINGTPLNFIEQLNQMFSDLVVLHAVEELLAKYPDKQFVVNFGAKAGFDIQSVDKMVVAECFAVTSVNSNDKLREDAKKLMKLPADIEKYIFFYSQNDTAEKLKKSIQIVFL